MKKSMSFSQRYERRLGMLQNVGNDYYSLDRQLGAITQGNRKYRTWQTRIKEADSIIDKANADGNNIRSLERYYRDLSKELETNRSLAKDDSRKSYAEWHLERVSQKIKDLKDSKTLLSTRLTDLNRLNYSQPQPVSVYDEARPVIAVLTPETKSSLENKIESTPQKQRGRSRASLYVGVAALALASCISSPQPRIYTTQTGAGDAIGIGLPIHDKMIAELKARNAPFPEFASAPDPVASSAVEKLAVSYESDRPVAEPISSIASVTDRAVFPFEAEVADQGSSLIPDAATIARYEEQRVHDQKIAEGRKEFGRRMYEGIRNGFAKVGNFLKGLDAKVASAIPSVPVAASTTREYLPVSTIEDAPAITSSTVINTVAGSASFESARTSSKKECGVIAVAREYGLLNETPQLVEAPRGAPNAGDALGRSIFQAAQYRAQHKELNATKPVIRSAPVPEVRHYEGGEWRHEPSHRKEVLVKTSDRFNPIAVQIEIGNSGILAEEAKSQAAPENQASPGMFTAGESERDKQIREYDAWLTKQMKRFKHTAVNGHY